MNVERNLCDCYNRGVPHASGSEAVSFGRESRPNQREANSPRSLRTSGFRNVAR